EALEIRRTLAKTNPQTYLPDLATTLVNLAMLNQRQENLLSLDQAKEALQILICFVESMPLAQELVRGVFTVLKRWKLNPKTFLEQHNLPLSLLQYQEA
ncbi:MAG: hypothetical protein AAFV78_20605, partial [Bacteroidota bacterium]